MFAVVIYINLQKKVFCETANSQTRNSLFHILVCLELGNITGLPGKIVLTYFETLTCL